MEKKNAAQTQAQDGASNDTANATTRQPPLVTGQCAEVLVILQNRRSVYNVELKLEYGITESAARIHELIERGFNIVPVIHPEIIYKGRVRRRVAQYVLSSPEWPRPGFFADDEGDAA